MPRSHETLREFVRENFLAAPSRSDGLRTVFQALSFMDVSKPYAFRRHQHLNFEIIIVDQGAYRCLLNGVELKLRRNHILVVKPGDWHQDFLIPPMRYYGLLLQTTGAAPLPPTSPLRSDAAPHQQVVDARREEFWPLLERLRRESELRDAIAPRLQELTGAEFFWRLMRRLPAEALDERFRVGSGEDRFAVQLRQLFAGHLSDRLSLARMAAALGISRSSLTARCRAQLEVSPARAFRQFKMERALELLSATAMTVTEVSDHLGFENPYHFSRVFRRHHGKPPSRVRK